MTSTDRAFALRQILDALVDVVAASGKLGTPGGTLYAALMTHGCSLEQFEQVMSALIAAKKLTKRGELYFAVEKPMTATEKVAEFDRYNR